MRLYKIDALRAVSVVLVVLTHAGLRVAPGGLGVTIFFVISGFVITKLLVREADQVGGFRVRAFFARRVLKIFPPLLALVILPSLLFFQHFGLDAGAVLSQVFFLYNWTKMSHGADGVLMGSAVVWSLAIEEQFYILIAALWAAIVRTKKFARNLALVYGALFIYSTTIRLIISLTNTAPHDETGNLPRIYYGTDCRISAIAIGGLLALWVNGDTTNAHKSFQRIIKILSSRAGFILGLVLLLISLLVRNDMFRDSHRYSMQELATAILIATSLQEGSWPRIIDSISKSKLCQAIGLASYTIYLSHLIIIKLFLHLDWIWLAGSWGVVVMTSAATVLGLALHQVLDVPFEKYRSRWRLQKKVVGSPLSTGG